MQTSENEMYNELDVMLIISLSLAIHGTAQGIRETINRIRDKTSESAKRKILAHFDNASNPIAVTRYALGMLTF